MINCSKKVLIPDCRPALAEMEHTHEHSVMYSPLISHDYLVRYRSGVSEEQEPPWLSQEISSFLSALMQHHTAGQDKREANTHWTV